MSDVEGNAELFITLTADIVAAHVSNNSVAVSDLPLLIGNVHSALSSLSTGSVGRVRQGGVISAVAVGHRQ
ncbi:MAG TPA: MucR family transcriptional regulator, partial [Sphingorhabdus sp.]|uniref:MucR family transcriptional regulator n=1 Tax=Sphingorhabdus sp. TaxID=1902408 RepID=UPI002B592116